MTVASGAAVAVVGLTSAFLFLYGVNVLFLSLRAARLPPAASPPPLPEPLPSVVVQLPIYDERHVAVRAVDAAGRLDWPRDRLTVQVLDDSDDDTVTLVAAAAERWRRAGVDVRHVRRRSRDGFKAGALGHGLTLTAAELVAVFDADFAPEPDFLRRAVGPFADPQVGFVQARWGHLNAAHSLFTRLQALITDFHFLVEQAVRPRAGWFTNFTGSAGIWRRAAIEDAGGWSAATLTEDLDLSYRAQLRGWRSAYLEDLVVGQELPVSVSAYRSQQSRWATGSFQCAFRLLGPVLRAPLPAGVRFEAAMHLLGYVAPLAMLAQVACYWLLLAGDGWHVRTGTDWWLVLGLFSLAPTVGIAVAQVRLGRPWWRELPAGLAWSVVGAGTSLTVAAALWGAVRGRTEFRRTPKFAAVQGEDWRQKAYYQRRDRFALGELAAGAAALALGLAALSRHRWLMALYALLFAAGFAWMALGSRAQAARDTRAFLRASVLLGLAGLLLYAVALLPDPFEDSYQHWLVAANLATTGRLEDPLFQMQDTWLPAYQVLAALVLKAAGIWDLAALKLANAAIGLLTLALTYRLAVTPRRGVMAVALLALNPIFLLTSTTAVAEPLLVAGLTGATLAASSGRLRLAAALAGAACLTGTKAWLWLGCAAGVVLVGAMLRAHGRSPRRWRLGWLAPALGLAVALEVGFGFASHSVARAALETSSAVMRGSVPAAPLARSGEFLGYLALASLPVAVLAPFGLAAELRRPGSGALVRLLYLPALAYLAAVTALIFAGVYSGSHRYYDPSLPALALLGAAALDRLPRPVALAAAWAAAAVTIGYLPVFGGLAADNRGLALAGRTAGAVPGALLTDSPVAAYWSRKPPSRIHGSRELPPGRAQAVGMLRAQGVGTVVVEDVGYYRATLVLPDLARGSPAAPFITLGDEPSYEVPGGKRVFAYGLDRTRAPLSGTGLDVAVAAGVRSPAVGKTAQLGKGAVLEAGTRGLAGGGLGFGVPIARFDDGWWYPGRDTTLQAGAQGEWVEEFDLSLHEVDGADGRFLRFVPGPSHGHFAVTYRIYGVWLHVGVLPEGVAGGVRQVVVLNEESSAFDDYADGSTTRLGDAVGSWTPVTGGWARFQDTGLHAEWEIDAPPTPAGFQAARELGPALGIDFSGLEMIYGPAFAGADYDVKVRRST